jgi:hypothetical protein
LSEQSNQNYSGVHRLIVKALRDMPTAMGYAPQRDFRPRVSSIPGWAQNYPTSQNVVDRRGAAVLPSIAGSLVAPAGVSASPGARLLDLASPYTLQVARAAPAQVFDQDITNRLNEADARQAQANQDFLTSLGAPTDQQAMQAA